MFRAVVLCILLFTGATYGVEQWFTYKKGSNPFLTSCSGLIYALKKGAKKQNGSYAAKRGKLTLA